MHLYSVDTLAMLTNARHSSAGLEKAAQAIVNPTTQLAYNQAKGSIPARRDIKPEALNPCARNAWDSFTMPDAKRLPSLAHRMAADDATKDAVAQILWKYLTQPGMTAGTAQQRLATVIRKPASESKN
jgi:glucose/mannose transport system substrate-binding protein